MSSSTNRLCGLERRIAAPVDRAKRCRKPLSLNDSGCERFAAWTLIPHRSRRSFNRQGLPSLDSFARDANTPGPITPTFVLPHKRYATFEITKLCRKVLDQNQSLRKSVWNADGRPVFHAKETKGSEAPALSHTTLWRWLTFMGAMVLSLQAGTEAFLQANPTSTFHRFLGIVHPSRARTHERLEMLSIARRLLHLQSLWDRQFLTTPFFAHFATVARPP